MSRLSLRIRCTRSRSFRPHRGVDADGPQHRREAWFDGSFADAKLQVCVFRSKVVTDSGGK